MKSQSRRIPVFIAALLSCASVALGAGEPSAPVPEASSNVFGEQRAAPQGFLPPVAPIMDIPMRDPHAVLGPDGFYYLTGTQPPDGDTDFWHPYNGIRLFRSPDLKHWDNLGYVYTLKANGTWQLTYNPGDLLPSFVPDRAHPKPTIWGPDIYHINGTWWIAYALAYNGWGSVNGLLKSTSGKPTGPYVDVGTGPLTTEIDPGLFQDSDGTVYYVWNNGKFARMNDAMSALAEKPQTATPSDTEQVAFEGAALRLIRGRYYMQAAGDGGNPKNYHGLSTYDTWIASSESVYGPYGPHYIAIRNGGHDVIFRGKRDTLWATFFGWNDMNPFNEKPAILRVTLDEYAHIQPFYNTFAILSPDSRVQGVGWNYTLSAPDKTWAQPDFNDRGWASGQGGFGRNVVATASVPVRTLWPTPDIWLRRHFTLPKLTEDSPKISLDIFHTGPTEVFINGVLAYTSTENERYYRESNPLSPEAEKALVFGGDNVIAVHSACGDQRYVDAGLRLFTHKALVPLAAKSGDGDKPLQIDLGKDDDITRTDVAFDAPLAWHRYRIEYSPDKAHWQVFYDRSKGRVVGDPCYTDIFDNGIRADHVTGRYLRLTVVGAQPGQPTAVKEFRVYGHAPVVDTDLARGKAVVASSADARHPPKNAVDDYWGSNWRSQGDPPQWLTVDLGTVQTIRACKTWFGTEGLVYAYRIETSPDNQHWTLFADKSANGAPCDPHYDDYADASARYVRLTELGSNGNMPVAVREFKIYGASTPVPSARPDIRAGLTGHWKLDETTGRTALDASPAHNDGTLQGSAAWLPKGRIGGALTLRGGSVVIPRGVGNAFTLSFWVMTRGAGPTGSGEAGEPLVSSAGGGWGVTLSGDTLALGVGDRTVLATDAINDGEWHHCAVTRTSSGVAQLVIDGVPQITTETPLHAALTDSGLILGGASFSGALDDVYVYDQPLSEAELALLATPPAALVGQWTFREGAGAKSADLSGLGSGVTLINNPAWSAQGVNGGSIRFGDDQSYGEVNRPVKDDFTVSVWVKTTQNGPERPWYDGAWLVNGEIPGDTNDFGASLSNGRFVFGTGAPDTSVTSKTPINDGKWHHCVATRQRETGTLTVYIDGKQEGATTAGNASLTAPSVLRLGSAGPHHFIGAISDLEIYDGALDNAAVLSLYRRGAATIPENR